MEKVLAIEMKVYGEGHATIATTLNNIGMIQKNLVRDLHNIPYVPANPDGGEGTN